MATSRVVNTHFWRDTYVIDLDPSEKLLFMYFLTNPNTNLSGIYEISLRQAAFDTGIDKDMIEKILRRFCEDGKMFYQNGWLVLRNFVKHQRLNPSIKKGIMKSYAELPAWLQEIIQISENEALAIEVVIPNSTQSGDSLPTDSPQRKEKKYKEKKRKEKKTNPNGVAGIDASVAEKVSSKQIDAMFDYWESKVGYRVTAREKQNREYCSKLLKEYSREDIASMIQAVAVASEDQYAPRVAHFIDLYRKWDELKLWGKKKMTHRGVTVI